MGEWIIGIDLGTTNCTLATAPKTSEASASIDQFSIKQRSDINFEEEFLSLPSFFYFPLEEEKIEPCVGIYARERGVEVPDRVISSAKSWLCHQGIDLRKRFLPLSEIDEKRSPIEVCASFLNHLKDKWCKKYPKALFENQTILITVPASFDPSARQYVLEASQMAGFPRVTLMEEPLAAFYAWLGAKEQSWREKLKVGDLVLVVDIGGGTTDFSLIRVEEKEGELSLSRQAVGDHLLLGGDNFDLALAHFTATKFSGELDEWQFQSLIHACRNAKEQLLSENAPDSAEIILHGRGSSLIGGTLTATLTKEDVEKVLLEGFFPSVSFSESLAQDKRTGITQLGLPYVRDPRVTAHLAAFLRNAGGVLPTSILFNGGTMKSSSFRHRILQLLKDWKKESVKELPDADLDFSVSRGAVYYGWTQQGKGIRVRAGTTRSYYIGIEGAVPSVPGMAPPIKAICLVPFGMEEGSESALKTETFTLLLEEHVCFQFFSLGQPYLPNGEMPTVGTVVKNWKGILKELHPIETLLHQQGEEEKYVQVTLNAKVTEMGMLELWCVSAKDKKWKLEFDIRKEELTAGNH